jgi:heptosyltransferase-2
MGKEDQLKRILIIRLGSMGDVLLTTPLIRMVKSRYPEAKIDFLVKKAYESLLRTNRHLNRLLLFSPEKGLPEIRRIIQRIRETGYDAIIDLQVNLRSFIFRILSGGKKRVRYRPKRWRRFLLVSFRKNIDEKYRPIPLRFLESVFSWGVEDDGLGLELEVEESARRAVSLKLGKSTNGERGKIVVLAPGASRYTKRWPAKKFADVGRYFERRGNRIVLVGGEQDRGICEEVARGLEASPLDFAGQLSLQETAAVIADSDLLVSNDTGIMHMSCALGKPVVAIFGPTTHHLGFHPFRTSSIIVEKQLPCRPCSYHGTDKCPRHHFRCMEQIQSIDVIRAAEELLKRE